jgi:hypothetical protein
MRKIVMFSRMVVGQELLQGIGWPVPVTVIQENHEHFIVGTLFSFLVSVNERRIQL